MANLRKEFEAILKENEAMPEKERLPRDAFHIDPGLKESIEAETEARLEETKAELAWASEKAALGLQKMEETFLTSSAVEAMELKALGDAQLKVSRDPTPHTPTPHPTPHPHPTPLTSPPPRLPAQGVVVPHHRARRLAERRRWSRCTRDAIGSRPKPHTPHPTSPPYSGARADRGRAGARGVGSRRAGRPTTRRRRRAARRTRAGCRGRRR